MDLPDSIAAIGERLDQDGAIVVDPQLLNGADVFAAERERLFMRPWVAVDHQSRIDQPGRYVRFDAATRSVLLTRDAEGRLRALRNVCLHAGYPICEAEEGPSDRLVCPYHGWEFTAEGRLVEPDLSRRIDPARLLLASYPVCVQDGLIFVDLSRTVAPDENTDEVPAAPGAVPAWFANGTVTRRDRYNVKLNWKLALQFVKSSPDLFGEGPAESDGFVSFGPLSLMAVAPYQTTLLRVIPKSAAQTDIQLIQVTAPGVTPDGAFGAGAALNGPDRISAGLREAAEAEPEAAPIKLDREFFAWYWPLMSA
jgi:nitrite reductase/ring-hydroxylating ferredoxin subunit